MGVFGLFGLDIKTRLMDGRVHLGPPASPTRSTSTGKKFEIGTETGLLHELIKTGWLLAVGSVRCLKPISQVLLAEQKVAPSTEHNMFRTGAKISSHAQSKFHPSQYRFRLKAPRSDDIEGKFEVRRGDPEKQVALARCPFRNGQRADVLKIHGWINVFRCPPAPVIRVLPRGIRHDASIGSLRKSSLLNAANLLSAANRPDCLAELNFAGMNAHCELRRGGQHAPCLFDAGRSDVHQRRCGGAGGGRINLVDVGQIERRLGLLASPVATAEPWVVAPVTRGNYCPLVVIQVTTQQGRLEHEFEALVRAERLLSDRNLCQTEGYCCSAPMPTVQNNIAIDLQRGDNSVRRDVGQQVLELLRPHVRHERRPRMFLERKRRNRSYRMSVSRRLTAGKFDFEVLFLRP